MVPALSHEPLPTPFCALTSIAYGWSGLKPVTSQFVAVVQSIIELVAPSGVIRIWYRVISEKPSKAGAVHAAFNPVAPLAVKIGVVGVPGTVGAANVVVPVAQVGELMSVRYGGRERLSL
jgi:hypothetical protein